MRKNLKFNFIFKENILFIIAIILIILICIIIYYTQNIESFIDIVGTNSKIAKVSGQVLNNCNLGGLCRTSDYGAWGIYNANCECIIRDRPNNILEEETYNKPIPTVNSAYFPNTIMPNVPPKHKSCVSNSSNFDEICKKQNINYQVLNLIKCNDTESRPECGTNIDSEDYSITTPCLNKSDDFNTWCRFYSNRPNKIGYNVNSIGAKKVLVGAEGGCFVNGKPDNSKARGVCTYDYTDEVIKLDAANPETNYNVFTECKYMKRTDFIKECSDLLNLDYHKTYADQITSYDCNPGFARAKCLNAKDKLKYNEIRYPINTTTNSRKQKCVCYDS